jgi:ribosome-associated protein
VEAVELGAASNLGEGPRQVHVAEDPARLRDVVRAAEENRLGVLADEVDAGEVLDDRRHRQREDPPACKGGGGRARRRLELVVDEVEPHPAELVCEHGRRPDCVVRDEAQTVPSRAQSSHGFDSSGNRFPGEVEDAVDVEENGRHVEGESIRVTRSVAIPRSEIQLRFSRSSGPGGQHAQKSESRVEALFDVAASTALTERQKRRVISRAGPLLRAVAQDERSQWRNRELATERLLEQLRQALRVERTRVPTKPSREAHERRLEEKRRRGELKRLRRSVEG